jgi:hypothetical protein
MVFVLIITLRRSPLLLRLITLKVIRKNRLLATTPRSEMHAASYVFGEVANQTGWPNTGLAFLFGILSVQVSLDFSLYFLFFFSFLSSIFYTAVLLSNLQL